MGWEGWCSNKIEGTWVPEALQSTPRLDLFGLPCRKESDTTEQLDWTELNWKIPLHWFQRRFQESPLGGGEVKQRRERNQWGVHYLLTAYGQLDLSHNGEYWEREECDSDVLVKERGSWGSYVPTAAETHWGILEKGALLTPGRVLWGQGEPQAGTGVRMSVIWVDRCDKSWEALAISSYICVCYTHPPLHPFDLAWNFRKEINLF